MKRAAQMTMQKTKLLLPLAAGSAILASLLLWLSFEFLDVLLQKRQRNQLAASNAFTFLQQSLASGARETIVRLPATLKLAADSGDFQYATALDIQGKVIAEAGSIPGDCPLPAMATRSGRASKGKTSFFWNTLVLPSGTAKEMENLKFVLAAQTNKESGNSSLTRLLTGLLFLGFVCAAAVMLAWSYFRQTQYLRQELGLIQKRREQIEELGLAAAGLAHETKNPLGLIRGCAQQIADGNIPPEECRRMAQEIMEEADVTSARLGDFLNYARIREPELRPVDAKAQLGRTIDLLKDDFSDAGVTLGSSIPGLTILADPEMLSQILLNLLLNSLKSTPRGGRVSVALTPMERDFSLLSIADTGSGIPPEILPNIFKPYVSKRAGGCGLGLAIVKRLTEQSGWEISIDSKADIGTSIQISGIRVAKQGDSKDA
ncbi:MAG: hypothetical protein A2X49_01485 [Lentisphaerae bacterium GWF2_52_8]|nr:MAG: hypothetical protein A2X49_01485 [Lentisphaerae bacterium GWF2_52_8]